MERVESFKDLSSVRLNGADLQPSAVTPLLYSFHDFELDHQLYQLRHRGKVKEIEPKVFNVLAYLIQHRERIVTKEELREKLWPGQVVSESALIYCVVEARKAVGDDGRKQQVIKTQHGRGYRFVAGVVSRQYSAASRERTDSSSQEAAVRTQDLRSLPLNLQLLIPFEQPSVAVLPFTNLSADLAQEYFSDGFTEDLITDLAKISGLFVIARHSAFTYKGKAVRVEQVGKELGVRYVVEGSVRKAGDYVRISAQLVDAVTGCHLWAERYDHALCDIFAVQDDLRRKIITALKVQLLSEEQTRLRRAPTNNLEAYDYYLRGLDAYRQLTPQANFQAQQLFARAIDLDPCYAAAYALLSLTYMAQWALLWNQNPQLLDQALATVQQALVFDKKLAGAHAVLSWVYVWKKLHNEALHAADRAIALDPNNTDSCSFVAQTLNLAGRPHDALQLITHAIRLNPYSPAQYPYTFGWSSLLTGQQETAIVALKKSVAMRPNWWPPHLFLALIYSDLQQHAAAQTEAAELMKLAPDFSLALVEQRMPYKDPALLHHTLVALRKAGLT